MNNLYADVAVVGYGPVGRMLAIALAEKGHSVVVIERQHGAYPLPRAVCMDHEIHRAIHAHGFGSTVPSYCAPSPCYRWFGQDWQKLLEIDWTVDSLSGGPEAYFFYQPMLEAAMAERVEQLKSVTLLYGHEAKAFQQKKDGVTIDVDNRGTGASFSIQAKYLVGADGANSVVRQGLGIEWNDLGFKADFLVVDVLLNEGVELDIPAAGQFCNPARPTTFVPGGIKEGRTVRRWEFMCLPHEKKSDFEDQSRVWPLLEKWVTPDQGQLVRHAVYTFRSLVAQKWQDGRIFLAGDAAHLTPPFLGQGMCSGMRDALNLAWRLDLVLCGAAVPAALAAYESERSPHITTLIEIAMYLGKIICVADKDAATARDRSFLDRSAPPPPEFPHLMKGTLRTSHGLAGRLSPHAEVQHKGTQQRMDALTGPNFVLVARNSDVLAGLGNAQRDVLKRLSVVQVSLLGEAVDALVVSDTSLKYLRFLDENKIDAFLARPDGYLFGVTPNAEPVSELVGALAQALPQGIKCEESAPMAVAA